MTVAGRSLELAHPVSVDDLLDEDDYNRHQRLPYWGTLWPSARMLAHRVADAEGRGRRLLELGCGVGLVSLLGGAGRIRRFSDRLLRRRARIRRRQRPA